MEHFSTERLQLAIFIHASGKLPFVGCESVRPGALRFVFEDTDRAAKQIELEFDRGATIPAISLFASQKYLRRTMTEALENRRIRTTNETQETNRHRY
jgi:hypothetical protein